MPHSVVTLAIVLRSVPYGEADRVVTLLGKSTGRVSAMARGSRKSQRRFGGGLGLGARGDATLRERPGSAMASLESFDLADARLGLGTDLGRTAHAAYAVELCDRLCAAHQADPALFDWLDEFLGRLTGAGATLARLRVFELGLLKQLGIAPQTEACIACGRLDLADEAARWQPERGGVVCKDCAHHGTWITAVCRRALTRLGRLNLGEAEAAELTREENKGCRDAIAAVLEGHLSRPLRSVEFMAKLGALHQ